MERNVITASQEPMTVPRLVRDLHALGVQPGMTLMVHTAMSKLGWIAGGAHAVVVSLLEAIGFDGTLVMPTHTGLTDPGGWENPPVPESWWPAIREHTPAYDPALTPTRGMGAVVECFRSIPVARRSAHPTYSATAVGPLAEQIVAHHPLDGAFGEASPYARLYDVDAVVLLLGVDHANNSSLHLAEHRATFDKPIIQHGAPLLLDGRRQYVFYRDLDGDSDDFAALGEAFADETGGERRGPVGGGEGRLVRQREIVDYAARWITRKRGSTPPQAERS